MRKTQSSSDIEGTGSSDDNETNENDQEIVSEIDTNQELNKSQDCVSNQNESPQNPNSESNEFPITPQSPHSLNSEMISSVVSNETNHQEIIESSPINNSNIDSLPKTPTAADNENIIISQSEIIVNNSEIIEEMTEPSAHTSTNSISELQFIPLNSVSDELVLTTNSVKKKNKSKNSKKRKSSAKLKYFPQKRVTRTSENDYKNSLTVEDKAIYDVVMQLNQLSIQSLSRPKTNHIIRPCISLVGNNSFTIEKWNYFDKFSKFYIRRFQQEKVAFQCKFQKTLLPKFNKKEEFEVVKIFGDLNNKEFLLVQYAPVFEDSTLNFDHYHQGEIQWIHKDIIKTNNKVYTEYLKGVTDFKGAFDQDTFDARPIERKNIVIKNYHLIEFKSDSLKILENLLNTRFQQITV